MCVFASVDLSVLCIASKIPFSGVMLPVAVQRQSSRAKFRKLREQSEKYLWNPRMCKTFDKGKVKTQLKTGLRLRLEDSICVI